jgi:Skp family chaperone for outer membrane proteins
MTGSSKDGEPPRRPRFVPRLMMQFSLPAVLGLFGWAFLLAGAVEPGSGPAVGIIDTGRITTESVAVQKAIAEASGEARKARDEYEKKRDALAAVADRYKKQESVASKTENDRRQAEIARLNEELEEIEFRLNRAIKRAQEKMVGPMGDKINAAIREICAARRIPVVIGRENVVYHDPSVDLTREVIARLDSSK